MTRHAGLMHPDLFDQVVHRTLAFANRVEDPAPGRFGDYFEDLERSRHGSIIRLIIYMCKQI